MMNSQRLRQISCVGYTKCLLVRYFLSSGTFADHRPGNNKQAASVSWWPKENVFTSSYLWPGYWSRGCEDWFQRRYHCIIQQHPQHGVPRISTHWQNALKFDKRIKQLHSPLLLLLRTTCEYVALYICCILISSSFFRNEPYFVFVNTVSIQFLSRSAWL